MRKMIHAVLWCLMLASSGAMAAITTMTFTGTFGAGASDLAVDQADGILGPPSSLAGRPFTLTLTIDDAGSYTTDPGVVKNVASVTGVLTVNGVSLSIGGLPATALETRAACGSVTMRSNTGYVAELFSVFLAYGSTPSPSMAWNAPCDVDIPVTQNLGSQIQILRGSTTSTSFAQLSGPILISHITVKNGTATPPPTATAITPQAGMWWNPSESGSGYVIERARDVLVVTIYSYKPNGDSEWYLASGPITNNVFVGTLDKYRNGQCISCAYKDTSMIGNDGTVTIELTSPTTGFMTLPNRGRFPISKFTF